MGTAPGSGVRASLGICITVHLWHPKKETHTTLDPKACCPFAPTPTTDCHVLCFKGFYVLTRQLDTPLPGNLPLLWGPLWLSTHPLCSNCLFISLSSPHPPMKALLAQHRRPSGGRPFQTLWVWH